MPELTAGELHRLQSVPTMTKVGPKGYIHGWIFVGAPGVGDRVQHPQHGAGTVTAHDGRHATVTFDKGGAHTFQAREDTGAGRLVPRDEHDARLADEAHQDPTRIHRAMSDEDLRGVDDELTRRAAKLGKPGQVSRTHQEIKDEIRRRVEESAADSASVRTTDGPMHPADAATKHPGALLNLAQIRAARDELVRRGVTEGGRDRNSRTYRRLGDELAQSERAEENYRKPGGREDYDRVLRNAQMSSDEADKRSTSVAHDAAAAAHREALTLTYRHDPHSLTQQAERAQIDYHQAKANQLRATEPKAPKTLAERRADYKRAKAGAPSSASLGSSLYSPEHDERAAAKHRQLAGLAVTDKQRARHEDLAEAYERSAQDKRAAHSRVQADISQTRQENVKDQYKPQISADRHQPKISAARYRAQMPAAQTKVATMEKDARASGDAAQVATAVRGHEEIARVARTLDMKTTAEDHDRAAAKLREDFPPKAASSARARAPRAAGAKPAVGAAPVRAASRRAAKKATTAPAAPTGPDEAARSRMQRAADGAVRDKSSIRAMDTEDLKAADAELGRRAAALGKNDRLDGAHEAVRTELTKRSNHALNVAMHASKARNTARQYPSKAMFSAAARDMRTAQQVAVRDDWRDAYRQQAEALERQAAESDDRGGLIDATMDDLKELKEWFAHRGGQDSETARQVQDEIDRRNDTPETFSDEDRKNFALTAVRRPQDVAQLTPAQAKAGLQEINARIAQHYKPGAPLAWNIQTAQHALAQRAEE
jgi:hypothetical protein